MFRNLKVSTRLALGFGVVTVLLVAVILLSVRSLAGINDNLDAVVGDKYPKVAISYDMIGNIKEISISMRNIVMKTDAEATRHELAQIDGSRNDTIA
ncbi:MAG TPA: MCP four helix bundle domain-containing protein, partial [Telluria sp.]